VPGARKVIDLWAQRSASLGARPDVAYVLVFENRGAEVVAARELGSGVFFNPVAPEEAARSLRAALESGRAICA
jgi:UDPglucose--hexose-1-phosphate uridylyltransferase